MRKFEKISKDNFFNSVPNGNYEDIILPKRSTKNSAGYDFYSLYDITIKPNERVVIPTGIKVCMNENEFLGIYIRSSLGFKYNIRMCNQVGLIDQDYYDNPDNEGHMWIKIKNEGAFPFEIKKHDRICQGIIINYLTVDNEEKIEKERISGIGSTTEVKK